MEHSSTAGGRVTVGAFVLDASASGGTRLYTAAPSATADVTPLRKALSGAEETIDRLVEHGVAVADTEVGRIPESLDKASTFTDRVEQAVNLATAIGEGRVTDVVEQIDGVLDLAGQLHRAGRYEDELRVLRALYRATVLTLRWVALVEVLRRAFSTACAYADTHATAWVAHELGTLSVVTGDRERGVRLLERAQSMRREAGDERGLEATDHNLGLATTTRAAALRLFRRPRSLVVLLSAVAAIVLLAGGGAMAVLVDHGGALGQTPTDTTTTTGGSSTTTGSGTGSDGRSTTTSDSTSTRTTTSSTTTPPPIVVGQVAFSGEPDNPTSDATAGFSFSATSATGFLCQLDGGATAPCDTGSWSPSSALADGRHTFTAWGVAGTSKGSPATYAWSIDTTKPSVVINSVRGGVASYTITDSSALANPTCEIVDSAGQQAGSVTSCTLKGAQYTGLTPGVYTFTVTVSDAARNTGTAASQPFKG
jgi:hypothetical protein